MAETKTQAGSPTLTKLKLPQKPAAPSKTAPLTRRIENKRVIHRLIDYFETKA